MISRIFSFYHYQEAITVYRNMLGAGGGEGARSAPFCVSMSLLGQVRAATGRVVWQKKVMYSTEACILYKLFLRGVLV